MQMRSVLCWDLTQRRMLIPYRRFGITYRSHLQGSSSLRRKFCSFISNGIFTYTRLFSKILCSISIWNTKLVTWQHFQWQFISQFVINTKAYTCMFPEGRNLKTKNRRLKPIKSTNHKKENSFIYRIWEQSMYAVVSRVQVTVEVNERM